MPMLSIRESKKIAIACSLEESIANQVNQYAAFLNVTADAVVNNALEYVFNKDREFQQYIADNPDAKPASGLRMKKTVGSPTVVKRPRKSGLAIAT